MTHNTLFAPTFAYHQLEIEILCVQSTTLDSWIGALLRNNFLYACKQVEIDEQTSLYDVINRCPLPIDHLHYGQLKEGAPKGIVLCPLTHTTTNPTCGELKKGEVVRFSLTLIGSMSCYIEPFLAAIQLFCQRGFGKPMVAFTLLGINERSMTNELHPIDLKKSTSYPILYHPHTLSSYLSAAPQNEKMRIRINFSTPTMILKPRQKMSEESYQDKLNCFPSFYQFVRSVLYRYDKLSMLYGESNPIPDIDLLLKSALGAQLNQVNLQTAQVSGTPQKEKSHRVLLTGYLGSMSYHGLIGGYYPLLQFMAGLHVGNEISYGFGQFEVRNEG